MIKRIAISGASGTGKTTLAKWASNQYRIPFVETSSKILWKKHRITKHLDIIKRNTKDPVWGIAFQNELLDLRVNLFEKHFETGFVSDRSSLDNICYFLLQCGPYVDTETSRMYLSRALSIYSKYQTHQVILPFTNDTKLEDDRMRINNAFYQAAFDAVLEKITSLYAPHITNVKVLIIPEWDLELRKTMMLEWTSNIKIYDDKSRLSNNK